MEKDAVWAAWNAAESNNLGLYMLDTTKMSDRDKVRRSVVRALPVLVRDERPRRKLLTITQEYHYRNYIEPNRTVPPEFSAFYAKIVDVFDFLQSVPKEWAKYVPYEERSRAMVPLLSMFYIPSMKPPSLKAMTEEVSKASWPADSQQSTVPGKKRKRSVAFESEISDREMKPLPRKTPAIPGSRSPKERTKNQATLETAPSRPSSVLETKAEARENTHHANTKAHIARDSNLSNDTPADTVVDWDWAIKNAAAAFRKLVESDCDGEIEQINIATPDGSQLFAAIVKKRVGAQYKFYSHPSVARDTTNEFRFEQLDLIPVRDVTELKFEDSILPKTGCLACRIEGDICVPTAIGSSCHRCIKLDYRHCDHYEALQDLVEAHIQIGRTTAVGTSETNLFLQEVKLAMRRLSARAEEHYNAASEFARRFTYLHRHTMHVVDLMGTEFFEARFTPLDGSPRITQHLNRLVDEYNKLTDTQLAKVRKNEPIVFHPPHIKLNAQNLFISTEELTTNLEHMLSMARELRAAGVPAEQPDAEINV